MEEAEVEFSLGGVDSEMLMGYLDACFKEYLMSKFEFSGSSGLC